MNCGTRASTGRTICGACSRTHTGRRSGAAVLLLAAAVWAGAATTSQAIWSALFDRGAPRATYYLGDYLTNDIYWAFNEDTGTGTHNGFGIKPPSGSWTWYSASWHQQNGANDEWKFTDNSTVQFRRRGITTTAGVSCTGGAPAMPTPTGWKTT